MCECTGQTWPLAPRHRLWWSTYALGVLVIVAGAGAWVAALAFLGFSLEEAVAEFVSRPAIPCLAAAACLILVSLAVVEWLVVRLGAVVTNSAGLAVRGAFRPVVQVPWSSITRVELVPHWLGPRHPRRVLVTAGERRILLSGLLAEPEAVFAAIEEWRCRTGEAGGDS